MRNLILIILLQVHMTLGGSFYGCMDAQTFHDQGKSHFSKKIQSEAGEKYLLKVLVEQSKIEGYGSYGDVMSIDGVKEKFVIKIQSPTKIIDILNVKREIELLKKMCGKKPTEAIAPFSDCKKSEVSAFRGCVEEKDSVYIFLRRAYSSLEKTEMLKKYRSFEPIKRIGVFLNILDLVIALHKKKIIHSDIKPANIVSLDPELKEFELIDLGMAGTEELRYNGGTKYYFPPEVSPVYSPKKLEPRIDVYSLAITMMALEIDFEKGCRDIDPNCFEKKLSFSCHASIIEQVDEVFKADKRLKVLESIFYKALSFYTNKRYSTVEEFSREIVQSLDKLPNFDCYMNEIRIEEERKAQLTLEDPKDAENLNESDATSKGYKWIDYAQKLGLFKPLSSSGETALSLDCKTTKDQKKNLVQKPAQAVAAQNETEKDDYLVEEELIDGAGAQTLADKDQAAKQPGRIFNYQIIDELTDEEVTQIIRRFPKLQLKASQKSEFAYKYGDLDDRVQVDTLQILI